MNSKFASSSSIVLLLTCAACATASPPKELLDARAAYSRAQQGSTAKVDPAGLHVASEALAAAERSYERDGDTAATRDFAYIALRRVEIADAVANTTQARSAQTAAVTAMHSAQADQLTHAKQQLDEQGQEITAERHNRALAEKRAADAASDLQKIASVKQEPRGIVITLSGGVLFASNKSELLPAARLKLNTVAETLTQQDPESKMVVEGHTDSQGSMDSNQELSQRRAQAVRDYLVSRGIASDRVTAAGFGSTRSVADNATPDGRANNRRIEIVVAPKPM
jgi:outer membrane protein OmpA-like peptidoglycan-associated protein